MCGLLFGTIYAGFEILVYTGSERFLWTSGGFALCGGVAGSLLGFLSLVALPDRSASTLDRDAADDDQTPNPEQILPDFRRREAARDAARVRRDRRVENRFPIGKRGNRHSAKGCDDCSPRIPAKDDWDSGSPDGVRDIGRWHDCHSVRDGLRADRHVRGLASGRDPVDRGTLCPVWCRCGGSDRVDLGSHRGIQLAGGKTGRSRSCSLHDAIVRGCTESRWARDFEVIPKYCRQRNCDRRPPAARLLP